MRTSSSAASQAAHRADVTALNIDEPTVAVSGDWHGNLRWVSQILPAIRRAHPAVRTVLHVGDFGLWPGDRYLETVDFWAKRSGLRILVTPGNHDDWDALEDPFSRGELAHVSETTTFMPRGYRFTVGGRTAMSFGGAASHDRAWRLAQRTKRPIWWPAEVAPEAEVEAANANFRA